MTIPSTAFLQQARDRADGLLRDPSFPRVPGLTAAAVMLPETGTSGGACARSCTWTGTFGTATNPV
ncbi:MAG: hypothetical protein JWM27_3556 [Gemmatimonadetes bacterium]|nr:hypothetical protein [Gemmatimonadota bacterium]